TSVESADENAQTARLSRLGFRVAPCRDAARSNFRVVALQIDVWIVLPPLRAGLRIECDHMIVGSAEEENPIHQDGSGFEGCFLYQPRWGVIGAGAISPCNFEARNVCSTYLRRRREASSSRIIAIGGPSRFRSRLSVENGERYQERKQQRPMATERSFAGFH